MSGSGDDRGIGVEGRALEIGQPQMSDDFVGWAARVTKA
jgi:hypothetical protein